MNKSDSFIKTLILYSFPFLALLLCLFSKETSMAARKALYLCLDVVIPSLFPFFVLSKILVPFISGFDIPDFLKRLIEKFFKLPYYTIIIILLGFISGYPNGAKMSRDMYDQGLIDSRQAGRILSVANYCSPLFIIGTVGAGLFKSVKLGVFLLLMHWASGIIAAFITGKLVNSSNMGGKASYSKANNKIRSDQSNKHENNGHANSSQNKKSSAPESMAVLLPLSIEEASILCIKISGYIVFFAVISELLSRLGVFSLLGGFFSFLVTTGAAKSNLSEFVSAFSRGLMEITSGSQAILQLKGTTLNMQLAAISLLFGFAGFSVHTQIMGIMKGTGCKYRVLFFSKLLHGIIGGLLTLLTIYLMPVSIQTSGLDEVSNLDLSLARPLIICVLLVSLIISPYRGKKKSYADK